jgi:hypothetical protein
MFNDIGNRYGVKLIMDDRETCLKDLKICHIRYDPSSLLIVSQQGTNKLDHLSLKTFSKLVLCNTSLLGPLVNFEKMEAFGLWHLRLYF